MKLIAAEDVEAYLYAQDAVAGAAQAAALETGGGFVTMSYSGPPVTKHSRFTAVERTNGVGVTVAYPAGFTNRLDVFNSSDLIESWWDLAVTTNVSPSTNWIEWTDASVTTSWVVVRLYAADADLDSDGDGFTDAREIFMYHTDPNNSTSKPVTVSGSVSYSGIETGTIFVLATVISNGWSVGCSKTISGPGSYSNNAVAAMRSYWFKAFRDANTNLSKDAWEPCGHLQFVLDLRHVKPERDQHRGLRKRPRSRDAQLQRE